MQKEFNFIIKDNPNNNQEDINFMFGLTDNENDQVIELEQNANMADVVTITGIYESKTKARKDGWNKPIPTGWFDKEIGKFKTRICIWNPSEPLGM